MARELVSTLLYTESKAEFENFWYYNYSEIQNIITKNDSIAQKFINLFEVTIESDVYVSNFNSQSLWRRSLFKVGTTTNHIEAIHMVLNKRVKKVRCYLRKIDIIYKFIKEKQINGINRSNSSGLEYFLDFWDDRGLTAGSVGRTKFGPRDAVNLYYFT